MRQGRALISHPAAKSESPTAQHQPQKQTEDAAIDDLLSAFLFDEEDHSATPKAEPSNTATTTVSADKASVASAVDDATASQLTGATNAKYSRFLVLDVVRDHYHDAGRTHEELILRLFDEETQKVRNCHLREHWSRTHVEPGDFVHVTTRTGGGQPSAECDVYQINNDHGMLVVHPDCLLSGTRIADSFDCARKAVLNERFNVGGPSMPMLLGTMLHEMFEISVTRRTFETEELCQDIIDIVQKHLAGILAVDSTETIAVEKMMEYVPLLQQWSTAFLRDQPVQDVRFELPNRPSALPPGTTNQVCISKVVDIEENIWCPQYGLKGKVDASVEVKIHTVRHNSNTKNRRNRKQVLSTSTTVIPLELKTGRVTARGMTSHRAQVILYMLMMDGRHREATDKGLLLYIKTGESYGLPLDHNDARALIIARNELVRYVVESNRMPEMLQSPSSCKWCFQLENCTMMHASLENGNSASSGLGSLYVDLTSHLTDAHLDYFRRWYKMIMLEYDGVRLSPPCPLP